MAQAMPPGLLSVLRPVVVLTRSCRLHRLTPHCERAPTLMNPACRDVPHGGSAKNLSSWYVPGGEMVQPDLCQLPCSPA